MLKALHASPPARTDTLWLLSGHSDWKEGVYLLVPSIHRNLEHFIPGAGSLGDLKQLGHARRPFTEHQPLRYHRDIPDQLGSREDKHAKHLVEAARDHWRLDWLGNRPFPDAALLTARLPVRLDHVGLGFTGSQYSFICDKTFMIVIGVALLLLLIWTEGFKASLDDAPALAKFQYETPNPGGYGATTLAGTEISSKPIGASTTSRSRKTRLLCTCSNTCLRCIGGIRRQCHSSPNGWRFSVSTATFEAAMSGTLVKGR